MSAKKALTAQNHLACVKGPDMGCVIPLTDGTIIGRQGTVELSDTTLSRHHCEVIVGRGHNGTGFLQDLSPTNSSQRSRLWRSRGGKLAFKPGTRFRLGRGIWVVRPRQTDLLWPHPPEQPANGKSPSMRLLRLLPLVFIAVALWRFLPGQATLIGSVLVISVTIIGLVILLRRRQRCRRNDGGHLFLVLLAKRSSAKWSGPLPDHRINISTPEMRVWLKGIGGPIATISPHHHLGFVGKTAYAHAQWIAAQVLLKAPHLTLFDDSQSHPATESIKSPTLWIRGPRIATELTGLPEPSIQGNMAVAWAPLLTELPPEVNRIIPACGPVGPSWLRSILECIAEDSHSNEPTELPTDVPISSLDTSFTDSDHIQRWQSFSQKLGTDSAWSVPVGLIADPDLTVLHLNLPSMGPHALLAGGTGSGKSVALRTWLTMMAVHIPPTALRMVLIDYKGGAGLGDLQNLPHIEQFHTDLEPAATAWLLSRLRQILQQRKATLRDAGFRDIAMWEASGETPPPRLLVIIDEFQALSEEHPQFLSTLSRLASQGRSLGLHLILATQRPGPSISADLRGTIDLRLALRCTEKADSQAIIGETTAAELPRIPGRALFDGKQFQFAQIDTVSIVAELQLAAKDLMMTGRESIWPAPLPRQLCAPKIDRTTVGLSLGVHEPQTPFPQMVEPLRWNGAPLLLAGTASSRSELADHAMHIANRWTLLTGNPVHLIGTSQSSQSSNDTWTSVVDPDDCGDVALLLSQILDQGPATLVVIEIVSILSRLDASGVGIESAQQWKMILQSAKAREITLIVTDTEGQSQSDRFTQKLLRLPDDSAWLSPGLLRVLPPLPTIGTTASLPSNRALTKEEVTSSISGRFLACGITGPAPSIVPTQLFDLESPQIQDLVPNVWRVRPLAKTKPPSLTILHGPCLSPYLQFPQQLALIGANQEQLSVVQQILKNQETKSSPTHLEQVPTDQWIRAVANSSAAFLAINPPLELIRYLSQRHPRDALWLRAHFPYPANTGVGSWEQGLRRISLPTSAVN